MNKARETRRAKPTLKEFKLRVNARMGNLTKVAEDFGVSRVAVWNWTKSDEDFFNAVHDAKMAIFDDCVNTARVVALGIPAFEDVLDEDGNPMRDEQGRKIRRPNGWIERPDSNMLRYFMDRLGKNEGFGEEVEVTVAKSGVDIADWIREENKR